MRDVECKLLSTTYKTDSMGIQEPTGVEERPIPIIKVEEVYANEFYEANEQGFKPTLRLRISALNYNNEKELIYMGVTYSIIRATEPYVDETVLVCERKVKNVK